MNLLLKAITLSAFVCLALGEDDNCAEKVDKFAQCVDDVRKDKDIQELIKQKAEMFKTCGGPESTLKCFKSKLDCASKALDTAGSSPEKKDSVEKADKCFQEKDLMEGFENMFEGLHYFGKQILHQGPPPPPFPGPPMMQGDMPPMPPPPPPGILGVEGHGQDIGAIPPGPSPPVGPRPPPFMGSFGGDMGGPPPPPGAVNSPMPMPPMMMPPPVFFLPDECDIQNIDPAIHECTMDKLFNETDFVKLVKTMKDKLNKCKDELPKDCHVKPPMVPCLMEVFQPTVKVAMDTYKDCMGAAGYKLPEPPMLPPMPAPVNEIGESKDKNSTSSGEAKKSGESGKASSKSAEKSKEKKKSKERRRK